MSENSLAAQCLFLHVPTRRKKCEMILARGDSIMTGNETLEELEARLQKIEDAEAAALENYEKVRADLENRIARHQAEIASLGLFKIKAKNDLQGRIDELNEELSHELIKTQEEVRVLRDEEYELTLKIRRMQGDPII